MNYATTLCRVAALCLLAGAAHASPVDVLPAAAAPGIAVPETVYLSALPFRPAAPEAASPDRAWREQNRIVAGYDPMMLTMAAHGAHAAASASTPDPHAGHGMHAAHAMEGKAAMPAGGCCKEGCCKDGCCKGAAGAGQAGMQGCCAKGGTDAPQSCVPARPAPGTPGAPPHPQHHGGRP